MTSFTSDWASAFLVFAFGLAVTCLVRAVQAGRKRTWRAATTWALAHLLLMTATTVAFFAIQRQVQDLARLERERDSRQEIYLSSGNDRAPELELDSVTLVENVVSRPGKSELSAEIDKQLQVGHADNPVSVETGHVRPATDKTEKSKLAFNAPEQVACYEEVDVSLFLSPSKSIEELKKKLAGMIGTREGAEIPFSPIVSATLSGGSAFEITPSIPEFPRSVEPNQVSEWHWTVRPVKAGKQRLTLTVYAMAKREGMESVGIQEAYKRDIAVSVSYVKSGEYFLGKNWQWFWAAALLPVAGWLLEKRKHRGHSRHWAKLVSAGAEHNRRTGAMWALLRALRDRFITGLRSRKPAGWHAHGASLTRTDTSRVDRVPVGIEG